MLSMGMKQEHIIELDKCIEELENQISSSSKRLELFRQMKELALKGVNSDLANSERNTSIAGEKVDVSDELLNTAKFEIKKSLSIEKIKHTLKQKQLFNSKPNIKFVGAAHQAIKNIETVEIAQAENIELLTALKKEIKGSTIKEDVISLLEFYGRGLTALEVLNDLKKRYQRRNLMRSSLSPQLSRLKQEGKLIYLDKKWILPKYLNAQNGIIGDASDVD